MSSWSAERASGETEWLGFGAMLLGSVTFLASLFFAWNSSTVCFGRSECLPDPFSAISGWSGSGEGAAMLAVALSAGAIAAMVDRTLGKRLRLGWVATAMGMFALLSTAELWTSAVALSGGRVALTPASYVGLAGVGLACAGAAAARWRQVFGGLHVTAAAGQLIALTLIASLVLPALDSSGQIQDLATMICASTCLGLLAWREGGSAARLATAAATGTLVAADLLPLRHGYARWPYEEWLLVGCAAGLLALSLAGGSALKSRRPSVGDLAIVSGSVLLLVSLFLPWQSFSADGGYQTQSGWSTAELAGVFALSLVVALVWTGRVVRELAVGAAIFVLSAALSTATFSAPNVSPSAPHGLGPPLEYHFVYGAPLGFTGTFLLLVGVSRFRPIRGRRFLWRLGPVLASLALLAFAVAPHVLALGDVVDRTDLFAIQSPFLTLGLVGAVAIFLTLRLLLVWLDSRPDHAEVVLIPFALLALSALAVIHDAVVTTNTTLGPIFGRGVSWEGWASVVLCVLLAACGWVERYRGGIESLRLPRRTRRVNQLSGAEG